MDQRLFFSFDWKKKPFQRDQGTCPVWHDDKMVKPELESEFYLLFFCSCHLSRLLSPVLRHKIKRAIVRAMCEIGNFILWLTVLDFALPPQERLIYVAEYLLTKQNFVYVTETCLLLLCSIPPLVDWGEILRKVEVTWEVFIVVEILQYQIHTKFKIPH